MPDLKQLACEACQANAPHVTEKEASHYLQQLSGWKIMTEEDISRLTKTYTFSNFVGALEFTNQVGQLAEQENHHPAIVTEWGKVNVTWWTHKIKGLHKNDFIAAAKTDALHSSPNE